MDLRLFLKALEKTEATCWSMLVDEIEAMLYKHILYMPEGFEPGDLADLIETLGMLRYDKEEGVFVVDVLRGVPTMRGHDDSRA